MRIAILLALVLVLVFCGGAIGAGTCSSGSCGSSGGSGMMRAGRTMAGGYSPTTSMTMRAGGNYGTPAPRMRMFRRIRSRRASTIDLVPAQTFLMVMMPASAEATRPAERSQKNAVE